MSRGLWMGVVGAMAMGAVAFAARPEPQGPPPPPQQQDGRRTGRADFEREAGITDAQRAQLRKIHEDDAKLGIRRRADMQIARMELNELLDAPTVDEKAVAVKVKALSDLQAAALKA